MLSTQLRSMSICIATVHTSQSRGLALGTLKDAPPQCGHKKYLHICVQVCWPLLLHHSEHWDSPRNQEKWLQLLTDSPESFWGEFTLYSRCLEVLSHIFSRQSSQSDSLKKKVLSLPVSEEMASFSPMEIRRKGASVLHVCNLIKIFIWNRVW